MVIVMQERATEEQIEKVVAHLVGLGLDVHRSTGVSRTVLGAVGDDRVIDPACSRSSTASAKCCG
jgi:3-deoxy-7-phosphoheptulonate synthase